MHACVYACMYVCIHVCMYVCMYACTQDKGQPSNLCVDGMWGIGTKNQNMGELAVPIAKPFAQDYYLNSLPLVCSAATLTVTVHGDLSYEGDSIAVYGEDGAFLGALFAGNLTYLNEGQRPYPVPPGKPHTTCSGAVRGGIAPDAAGNTPCTNWSPGDEHEASSQTSTSEHALQQPACQHACALPASPGCGYTSALFPLSVLTTV